MPPIETFERNQTAVLWEYAGVDGYGEQTIGLPQEIAVRWQKSLSRSGAADRYAEAFDAVVYAAQDVAIGSIMFEGTLEEAFGGTAGTADGDLVSDAVLYEVKDVYRTVDLKNRNTRRRLGLMRYGGNLP